VEVIGYYINREKNNNSFIRFSAWKWLINYETRLFTICRVYEVLISYIHDVSGVGAFSLKLKKN
jgi:hypothetical protein